MMESNRDDPDFVGLALGRAEYLRAEVHILQRRVDNQGWIGGVSGQPYRLLDNQLLRLRQHINDMTLEADDLEHYAENTERNRMRKFSTDDSEETEDSEAKDQAREQMDRDQDSITKWDQAVLDCALARDIDMESETLGAKLMRQGMERHAQLVARMKKKQEEREME
jgi:TolA-binding protein